MGFEKDGEGVAIKFTDREDDLLEKTGERKNAQLKTFLIPDDEELVGFHGSQDQDDKILELGIITRKKNC